MKLTLAVSSSMMLAVWVEGAAMVASPAVTEPSSRVNSSVPSEARSSAMSIDTAWRSPSVAPAPKVTELDDRV